MINQLCSLIIIKQIEKKQMAEVQKRKLHDFDQMIFRPSIPSFLLGDAGPQKISQLGNSQEKIMIQSQRKNHDILEFSFGIDPEKVQKESQRSKKESMRQKECTKNENHPVFPVFGKERTSHRKFDEKNAEEKMKIIQKELNYLMIMVSDYQKLILELMHQTKFQNESHEFAEYQKSKFASLSQYANKSKEVIETLRKKSHIFSSKLEVIDNSVMDFRQKYLNFSEKLEQVKEVTNSPRHCFLACKIPYQVQNLEEKEAEFCGLSPNSVASSLPLHPRQNLRKVASHSNFQAQQNEIERKLSSLRAKIISSKPECF